MCGCAGSTDKKQPQVATTTGREDYQGPGSKSYTWNGPTIRTDTGSTSK